MCSACSKPLTFDRRASTCTHERTTRNELRSTGFVFSTATGSTKGHGIVPTLFSCDWFPSFTFPILSRECCLVNAFLKLRMVCFTCYLCIETCVQAFLWWNGVVLRHVSHNETPIFKGNKRGDPHCCKNCPISYLAYVTSNVSNNQAQILMLSSPQPATRAGLQKYQRRVSQYGGLGRAPCVSSHGRLYIPSSSHGCRLIGNSCLGFLCW